MFSGNVSPSLRCEPHVQWSSSKKKRRLRRCQRPQNDKCRQRFTLILRCMATPIKLGWTLTNIYPCNPYFSNDALQVQRRAFLFATCAQTEDSDLLVAQSHQEPLSIAIKSGQLGAEFVENTIDNLVLQVNRRQLATQPEPQLAMIRQARAVRGLGSTAPALGDLTEYGLPSLSTASKREMLRSVRYVPSG